MLCNDVFNSPKFAEEIEDNFERLFANFSKGNIKFSIFNFLKGGRPKSSPNAKRYRIL